MFTLMRASLLYLLESINSSALLLRSKTPDPNKQIGLGLSIHPSPLVIAEFSEEIRAFEGIPMSYHISEYSAMNGVPGIMHNDPPIDSELLEDQKEDLLWKVYFLTPANWVLFFQVHSNLTSS